MHPFRLVFPECSLYHQLLIVKCHLFLSSSSKLLNLKGDGVKMVGSPDFKAKANRSAENPRADSCDGHMEWGGLVG